MRQRGEPEREPEIGPRYAEVLRPYCRGRNGEMLGFGEAFFAKLVKLKRRQILWRMMMGNCPKFLERVQEGVPPTEFARKTEKIRRRFGVDRRETPATIRWIRVIVRFARLKETHAVMMGYSHCLKILYHRNQKAKNEWDPRS